MKIQPSCIPFSEMVCSCGGVEMEMGRWEEEEEKVEEKKLDKNGSKQTPTVYIV